MSEEMSFLDHIDELRARIIKIILGMIVPIALSMIFYEQIFHLLMMPIKDPEFIRNLFQKIHLEFMIPKTDKEIVLQAINPTDTFLTALKIAVTAGIFFSFPIIVYQIWSFISPALSTREKRYTLPVVFFASLFFIIGGAFAYFIVAPFSFNFLAGFGGGLVENQWGVSQYFDLILKLLLVFGLVFELPNLAFILARLDLISAEFLRKSRRISIILILVLSSILTPPDVVSQLIMAIPLYFLYEVSILIVVTFRKKSPFDE